MNILKVENLTVRYSLGKKEIHAVEDATILIRQREFLGVVGESGSGKSTLAHAVMRLLPRNARLIAGKIDLLGYQINDMSEEELRKFRWKEFSIVFQRSMNALSPVHKIEDQISEALVIHNPDMSFQQVKQRIESLLNLVNLPSRILDCYPHQLSGGMMQRVMIALALVNLPKFIILDEATTALDVVTQGQIIEELKELIEKLSLTGMVISHDLGVVSELCDRIVVMYAGRIVEYGMKEDIIHKPMHPYTQALVASLPDRAHKGGKLYSIPGTLPDLSRPIQGCVFASRCAFALDECRKLTPPFCEVDGHGAACLKVRNERCRLSK
ncbi:MAG: ABC transporter ATP-binding protein [Pseudothermotoga sp.]